MGNEIKHFIGVCIGFLIGIVFRPYLGDEFSTGAVFGIGVLLATTVLLTRA